MRRQANVFTHFPSRPAQCRARRWCRVTCPERLAEIDGLSLSQSLNASRASDHEELRTMSATLSAPYRTLLVSSSDASRTLLGRLLDGSDIVIDDMVEPDHVIASVAR